MGLFFIFIIFIPMGLLLFHGIINIPWDFKITHGIYKKILWENLINFPWEFTPVFLMISPAMFEQIKSNAEPDNNIAVTVSPALD